MRQFLIITLALLYVTSLSGVSINRHFCGGKLVSVNFSSFGGDHCGRCSTKKMKKGCCNDRNEVVKVKCEHEIVGQLSVSKDAFKVLPFHTLQCKFEVSYPSASYLLNCNLPPPKPNISLLVLNSIFRI
jgi:hypothetical protein